MKKMLICAALLLMGAGCTSASGVSPQRAEPSTTPASSELWIVSGVNAQEIAYTPIDWLTGDEARAEAQKDGIECGDNQACLPNGYYLKYRDGVDADPRTWTLGDTSNITVKLICNSEDCTPDNPQENGFVSMSYEAYLQAAQGCFADPFTCPYYGIAADMQFFNVTFNNGVISSLEERYVP